MKVATSKAFEQVEEFPGKKRLNSVWIAVDKGWKTSIVNRESSIGKCSHVRIVFNFKRVSQFRFTIYDMTTGYSGTPLYKKLGILPSHKIIVDGYAGDYNKLLGITVDDLHANKNAKADLLHLFVKNIREMEIMMKKYRNMIESNDQIIIWVSWYKKSSGIATDVTEDTIRNYALANRLVDVKVCAVDEQWSALKLVVPLKLRTSKSV